MPPKSQWLMQRPPNPQPVAESSLKCRSLASNKKTHHWQSHRLGTLLFSPHCYSQCIQKRTIILPANSLPCLRAV